MKNFRRDQPTDDEYAGNSHNFSLGDSDGNKDSAMRTSRITPQEREKAFTSARKPEVNQRQRLNVRYHVEDYDTNDRPRRFLEAFAAILKLPTGA